MARVLRPGGRLVILEITAPSASRWRASTRSGSTALVPVLGTLAGDRDAYSYLPTRSARFPEPERARGDDRSRRASPRSAGCCSPAGSSRSTARPSAGDDPLLGTTPRDRGDGRRGAPGCPRAWRQVEDRLAELCRRLRAAARRGGRGDADAGGKRLRPLLVLMAAGDGAGDRAVRAATAVELVHMATLVHDDVLDGAPVAAAARRSSPARAGTAPSGSGDLLLSRAFAELAVDGEATAEVAELQLGLGRARARRAGPAPRRLRHLDHRGALPRALLAEDGQPLRVRLPARAPRLRRGRDRATLATFGREIGLAFQLLDDVLDVTGPPERTGKARGTDLLDGTVTLPLILARAAATRPRVRRAARARPAAAEELCDRIAATEALDEVRSRAKQGIEQAKGSSTRRTSRDEERAAARDDRRRGRRAVLMRRRAARGPLFLQGGDSMLEWLLRWCCALEVFGEDAVARQRARRSGRPPPPCWPG